MRDSDRTVVLNDFAGGGQLVVAGSYLLAAPVEGDDQERRYS